jgi:hypothetical protein
MSHSDAEPARALAGLARAERLCAAYETYCALVAAPAISFERAVFLLSALTRGDELVLERCRECDALVIADRCALRAPCCLICGAAEAASQRPLDFG